MFNNSIKDSFFIKTSHRLRPSLFIDVIQGLVNVDFDVSVELFLKEE